VVDSKSLLLTFLRKGNEEEVINQLRGLNEDEWEGLLAMAAHHWLGPILFNTLKPYYNDIDIPPYYQEQLRRIYLNAAARNVRLYNQLEEVVKKLGNNGISVILLKGSHLAKYVYGNISLRPMGDIDLMVKQGDLEKAHNFFLQDGYSSMEEPWNYQKNNGIPVEIHTHIKRLPHEERVNIKDLWARADRFALGREEVFTLCPEDLILHLSLHSCIEHDLNNGLKTCFDIAHTANFYERRLNWEQLWNRAEDWGIENTVYLMMALTEKLLALPMPDYINNSMNPDQVALGFLSEAEELIFERPPELGQDFALLFEQRGLGNKIGYMMKRAFAEEGISISAKQENGNIKIIKNYFLYLLRPWALFKKYRNTIWQSVRRDPKTLTVIDKRNRITTLKNWLMHSE